MINLIGLANKARKLTIGTEITMKGVRSNKVKVVFLALDASDNTKKLVSDKCSFYKVAVIDSYNTLELSNAIGKDNIKTIGITDEGFSKTILNQKRK